MPSSKSDRLEAGDDNRHLIAVGNGLIFAIAHDRADVAGTEEALHPIQGRLQDGGDGGRHKDVRNQDGKIFDALLSGLPDGHGVGRSGGLESDGKEDDFFVGIGPGDFQAIDGRINDAHVRAARFEDEQIDF